MRANQSIPYSSTGMQFLGSVTGIDKGSVCHHSVEKHLCWMGRCNGGVILTGGGIGRDGCARLCDCTLVFLVYGGVGPLFI